MGTFGNSVKGVFDRNHLQLLYDNLTDTKESVL